MNNETVSVGMLLLNMALAMLVLMLMKIHSKREVIKRDGWRVAFAAWGGVGNWIGTTLLVAASCAIGSLLLMRVTDWFAA